MKYKHILGLVKQADAEGNEASGSDEFKQYKDKVERGRRRFYDMFMANNTPYRRTGNIG